MLDPADLSGGASRFLATQTFAVLTARDHHDRLWVSSLAGPPGFLEVSAATTLQIHVVPQIEDPLHDLPSGQPVGVLAIDFSKRRRFRINGRLTDRKDARLTVEAEQAYGNCPQYIHPRELADAGLSVARERTVAPPQVRSGLTTADAAGITAADTFFLGTTHPTRGADASHRGGPAGFVRVVDDHHLWWPDYPGNNMFNSFGNLAVDPTAALLFYDFTSCRSLHLSGTAKVEWTDPGVAGDDGRTGRRVGFTVEQVVVGPR
ncbi:MAG TPA: pyridoxamine 5'-phosphate oxidase family protein [Mycobacteriales bacterium]|nr:pyridoxamine 5'-phosphate oxidase family protein [Mycobacteriales bacterium]